MIPIYIVTTTVWNGTVQLRSDLSAFLSKETAESAAKAVEKANENSDYKVTAKCDKIDMFTHKSEVPILNPESRGSGYGSVADDIKESLENSILEIVLATLKARRDETVSSVEFRADNLQESVKYGTRSGATHANVELYGTIKGFLDEKL